MTAVPCLVPVGGGFELVLFPHPQTLSLHLRVPGQRPGLRLDARRSVAGPDAERVELHWHSLWLPLTDRRLSNGLRIRGGYEVEVSLPWLNKPHGIAADLAFQPFKRTLDRP